MRRSLLLTLLVTALGPASAARADGDPASDVLLSQDVFLPYAPNTVSKPMAGALTETVKRAAKRGFGVKVAVVADARGLGSAGQLVSEPQRYADLLTQELSVNGTHGRGVSAPRVLAVLPSGIGGNNLGDRAGDALGDLVPPADGGGDGLARTAAVAVGRLAAAEGKPFALPALPRASAGKGDAGGGFPSALLFALPVLLVVIGVVAVNARSKPADADAG